MFYFLHFVTLPGIHRPSEYPGGYVVTTTGSHSTSQTTSTLTNGTFNIVQTHKPLSYPHPGGYPSQPPSEIHKPVWPKDDHLRPGKSTIITTLILFL